MSNKLPKTKSPDPPNKTTFPWPDNFLEYSEGVRFYISYESLPLNVIGTFLKRFDELYNLVYNIVYEEGVPKADSLALTYISTGNSIDGVVDLVKSAFPSKKAQRVLLIAAAVVATPFVIEKFNQVTATKKVDEATSRKIDAETMLIHSQVKKTEEETRSITYENLLKRINFEKDSMQRIGRADSAKKIMRKKKHIENVLSNYNIDKFIINNVVVLDRASDSGK